LRQASRLFLSLESRREAGAAVSELCEREDMPQTHDF